MTAEEIKKAINNHAIKIWQLKKASDQFKNWNTMILISEILTSVSDLLFAAVNALEE